MPVTRRNRPEAVFYNTYERPPWQKNFPLKGVRDCWEELGLLGQIPEAELERWTSHLPKHPRYVDILESPLILKSLHPSWQSVKEKYPESTWDGYRQWIQDIFYQLRDFAAKGEREKQSQESNLDGLSSTDSSGRTHKRKREDENNSHKGEQDNRLGGTLSLYSTEVRLLDLKKRVKEVREKHKELEERRKSATLEKETKYAKTIEVYEALNKQLEEPIPDFQNLKKQLQELREKHRELEERRKNALLEKERKYTREIERYEALNKQLEDTVKELETANSDDELN